MKYISCFVVAVILLFNNEAKSQLISFVDYGEGCITTGNDLGGILPPESAWLVNQHCKNYNGSVSCYYENESDVSGICECNMGKDSAHFVEDQKICLGKVGAYCTAEKTDLIPPKLCTPNADCVPTQSDGHIVGKCACRYGFKNENGLCVADPEIPEGQRSTPRTTTTTEAPDRGNLRIPLDILLHVNVVEYGNQCQGPSIVPLLNKTYCNTKELTVACLGKKCECNMGRDDAIFDDEVGRCVGLSGSYCLTRENLLGMKGCVKNAKCKLADGLSSRYSFGTCQCEPGYIENPQDGTCIPFDGTTTTTERGTGPTTSTTEGGTGPTTSTTERGTGPTTSTTDKGTGSTDPGTESTTAGAGKNSPLYFGIVTMLFYVMSHSF